MENKKYRLCQIEEVIAEADNMDIPDDVVEIDDDFQIVLTGMNVRIPSLGLVIRSGMGCNWEPEEEIFMPDFSLTAIYEDNGANEPEPSDYLYFEQDDFCITLGNWLNGRMSLDEIEQLWCELIIPEQ